MKAFSNRIKRILCRMGIMEKILFRDLGYICMLLCIPLIIFSVQGLSKEKSGMVKIALVNENVSNLDIQQTLEKMIEGSNYVNFYFEQDRETAGKELEDGKIDAVWVFPEDIDERIEKYAKGTNQDGIIIFYEGTESIILNMAREKAFEAIYSDVIYRIFSDYVIKYVDAEIQEAELKEMYEAALVEDSIFEYHSISGEDATGSIGNIRLVSAPVMGILAVYLFFIALMVSMILIRDKKSGAMQRLDCIGEWTYGFCFRMVAAINVAVITWVGLLATGTFTNAGEAGKEILILLCYAYGACAMAQLMGEFLKNAYVLCSISILITISSLVLCPVLIPSTGGWWEKLYPVSHYLAAENAFGRLYILLIYGAICTFISLLLCMMKRKGIRVRTSKS